MAHLAVTRKYLRASRAPKARAKEILAFDVQEVENTFSSYTCSGVFSHTHTLPLCVCKGLEEYKFPPFER